MYDPLFITALIGISMLIAVSIFMIKIGSKKREDGTITLGLVIAGWSLLVLTIIGSIVGLIVYIDINGGGTGTLIFTIISPIFIFIGFVAVLSVGGSSLSEGYHKDKDGKFDKARIVRGWFMLALAIAFVAAVIITLVILFNNHSAAQGDRPIRTM